ncbi:PP2C family serine/threonine-protein phosphatase [Emticicia fontis]
MIIYTALQKGEHHPDYCEDYYFVGEPGNDTVLCAVMDGCTMATDSYFASTLVGKLLRKIAKEKSYKALYGLETYATLESQLKDILAELFKELNLVENQLMLDKTELLTTLIIMLIDKKAEEGIILAIGDGVVSVNGKVTEFDHNNIPDYIGYHLHEDFEEWYEAQKQKIYFHQIKDISLSTDGIFTFMPTTKNISTEHINPVDFMLFDKMQMQNSKMLNWQLKHLELDHGLKPADDFAMVRVIAG